MKSHVEYKEGMYYPFYMGGVMRKVNQYGPGGSFGDVALRSEKDGEPRVATAFCSEDCEFAVLDRESYNVVYP